MAVLATAMTIAVFTSAGRTQSLDRINQQIRAAPARVVPDRVLNPAALAAAPLVQVARPAEGVPLVTSLSPADEHAVASRIKLLPSVRASGVTPGLFKGVVRQQTPAGSEAQLTAFVLPGGSLARGSDGRFTSTIRVGVADIANLGANAGANPGGGGGKLGDPITFQVLEEDLATPSEIVIDQVSPPFRSFAISTRSPLDGVTVHVVSSFDPKGVPVTLAVAPELHVAASRPAIDAFGLEDVEIEVTSLGSKALAGRPVAFTAAPSGYLSDADSVFDANGTARVRLRSAAPGITRITASSPGIAEAGTPVTFQLPVLTAMASLLGSLLGGILRFQGSRRRRWGRDLAVSLLTGFLVFAMYVVGIRALPFTFTVTAGAAFVFVVSALGAYLGIALLTRRPAGGGEAAA